MTENVRRHCGPWFLLNENFSPEKQVERDGQNWNHILDRFTKFSRMIFFLSVRSVVNLNC